ncbi:MAG: 50S ribosomal protein L13 [Clostridia bacterium]|nr:50S ribosomal protein L13 [Clostridia bacterium]MBQ4156718.1 50S ribosomal protein L13 [Clostridia bacterium]
MSTFMAQPKTVERKWYVIDAEGLVLGRLASQVALMLRGKHKPTFTPHVDTGDYIIVVNTDKIVLTGRKLDQKIYYHHTGHPGGMKETKYRVLMANKSEFALKKAVRGMLPKGPLGNKMFKKLKVYAGSEHEHQAQKPEVFEVK